MTGKEKWSGELGGESSGNFSAFSLAEFTNSSPPLPLLRLPPRSPRLRHTTWAGAGVKLEKKRAGGGGGGGVD